MTCPNTIQTHGQWRRQDLAQNYMETRNACQSPAVAHQAQGMPHALRRPAKTSLASDQIDAPDAYTTLSATRPFHFVHTAGVLWVHNTFFVPVNLDLWLLTLTFQLVRAKDQTRLSYEYCTNPFSVSCHILLNARPNNRTRFNDFAHLASKPPS